MSMLHHQQPFYQNTRLSVLQPAFARMPRWIPRFPWQRSMGCKPKRCAKRRHRSDRPSDRDFGNQHTTAVPSRQQRRRQPRLGRGVAGVLRECRRLVGTCLFQPSARRGSLRSACGFMITLRDGKATASNRSSGPDLGGQRDPLNVPVPFHHPDMTESDLMASETLSPEPSDVDDAGALDAFAVVPSHQRVVHRHTRMSRHTLMSDPGAPPDLSLERAISQAGTRSLTVSAALAFASPSERSSIPRNL